ncbi:MAG: hypothetical protein H7328_08180 [Bdellovibrio sp.]|nr:hypothetical protein [Bdellovibrio sp.]
MSRVDSFLIIIIILLSGLFVIHKTAEFQFSGVDFERQKNKQLAHQIKQMRLQEKVAEIEKRNLVPKQTVRSIASVPSSSNQIKESAFDANKELMNSSDIAESYYKKAELNCEKYKKEDICTENIEVVISQFPETRWAGESLILLGRLYLKTRQNDRANEVMKIIAREFKGDKEIQGKLFELKRSQF